MEPLVNKEKNDNEPFPVLIYLSSICLFNDDQIANGIQILVIFLFKWLTSTDSFLTCQEGKEMGHIW